MRLEELLQEAKKVALSGHIRPDGDCVGSVMSVYQYIKKNMPEIEVKVFLETPSSVFDCIKGVEDIDSSMDTTEEYDIFIAMDCTADRLGNAQKIFDKAKTKINIDHHISNSGCGDINVLVPDASSTCEVVYELMNPEKLDVEIAKTLYIGIIHDTGVFKYSNTSPKTLKIAADLIAYGFDFSKIIDETFYEKTYIQTLIGAKAVSESVRFMDGKCIFSVVDKNMMQFFGVGPKDLDGVINQLRIVKGVECAIFMYQTGDMEYKVSLRSNGMLDVSVIASFFGGGGHVRAAGCTMKGTPHDVINNLSAQIALQLS
ncbi:MAG: bifunctional oligoribonuclease/PAP phosphatase NrnA [Lachnospiraceae bacterium]|nr:bifunctional oligoribonuclease/PAP phosphatase NrnA [Lachnospiraceae bacterium]